MLRAVSRSVPTAGSTSAIDPGPFCRCRRTVPTLFASIPPSVAAFHLAFGPDGFLYVAAPTLASHDVVYRVSPAGEVDTFCSGLGRPQGLAFDADGNLYVVDALAGANAIFRIRPDRPGVKECVMNGGALLGIAFDPRGGIIVCSSETIYRLGVDVRGLLPVAAAAGSSA